MDRVIVYPGTVPQDTDILNTNKNAMISDAFIMQAVFGQVTNAWGLTCTPGNGLSVDIGPGCLNMLSAIDATPYGSVAADTADQIVKTGINISSSNLVLTDPQTPGYSINYLIEAQLLESDGEPLTLSYYDAANPTVPYTGPLNTGTTTNTVRTQRVSIRATAGLPEATGAQQTPSPDAGYVGLWVVEVEYGQTGVLSSAISQYPSAPFSPFSLQQLAPGFSRQRVFGIGVPSNYYWTVPAGVTQLRLTMWGGGGGGGNGGGGGYVGGGGAGGGYLSGVFGVVPGTPLLVTVGAGGAAGQNGGNTSLGNLATATGGQGGSAGSSSGPGGGGAAYGGVTGIGSTLIGDPLNLPGTPGGNGIAAGGVILTGGWGGGSGLSAIGAQPLTTGTAGIANGETTTTPGCGGSGGIGTGRGGNGALGAIMVEW